MPIIGGEQDSKVSEIQLRAFWINFQLTSLRKKAYFFDASHRPRQPGWAVHSKMTSLGKTYAFSLCDLSDAANNE